MTNSWYYREMGSRNKKTGKVILLSSKGNGLQD